MAAFEARRRLDAYASRPPAPSRSRRLGGIRNRLADQGGITLVELMTVMGMLGVALMAAFFFYVGAINRTAESEARVNTLSELNIAGERMARDIRESAQICAPSPPTTGADYLALALPSTGTPCDDPSRTIVYDCSTTPGTCTRTEGGGSPAIAVDGLEPSSPVFASTGGNYVSIDLRKIPEDRDRAIAFQRGATLRNDCGDTC